MKGNGNAFFLFFSIYTVVLAARNDHAYGWVVPLPIFFVVLIAFEWRHRRNSTTSEPTANHGLDATPNSGALEAPSRIFMTVAAGLVVTVYVVARLLNVDSGVRAAFVTGTVVLVTAVTALRFYVRGSRSARSQAGRPPGGRRRGVVLSSTTTTVDKSNLRRASLALIAYLLFLVEASIACVSDIIDGDLPFVPGAFVLAFSGLSLYELRTARNRS